MTKKEFKELTGEDPEDVMGMDWRNDAEEFNVGIDSEEADIMRRTAESIALIVTSQSRDNYASAAADHAERISK